MEQPTVSKHAIWATAAVLAVAAMSYWTAQYNIEQEKQRAFMMKACVDVGGQWQRDGWSTYYICARPRAQS